MREQRPGWIADVPERTLRAVESPDPEVGQIRPARPDQGPDLLVLLIAVHDDHVEAMLCSDEPELATEGDSVLEPSATGHPRRLLVHGDAIGRILNRRLGESTGRVRPHIVECVALRGRGLDFNSTDLGRGRAILGESDPRWEWKLDKLRQFRTVRARASELGWEIYTLGDPSPGSAAQGPAPSGAADL